MLVVSRGAPFDQSLSRRIHPSDVNHVPDEPPDECIVSARPGEFRVVLYSAHSGGIVKKGKIVSPDAVDGIEAVAILIDSIPANVVGSWMYQGIEIVTVQSIAIEGFVSVSVLVTGGGLTSRIGRCIEFAVRTSVDGAIDIRILFAQEDRLRAPTTSHQPSGHKAEKKRRENAMGRMTADTPATLWHLNQPPPHKTPC